MAEEQSKLTETTKAALSSVQSSGLVQHYVKPAYAYLWGKYSQSPTLVRWLIFGFVAMSAIPIGCFLGFMSLVTIGCLIVGGIAFAIVEVARIPSLVELHPILAATPTLIEVIGILAILS